MLVALEEYTFVSAYHHIVISGLLTNVSGI